MKTKTFTSTIAPELIAWLNKRACVEKRTRRAVLEDALRQYQKEITRTELREGFHNAVRDIDVTELAEWGMDDYSDMLNNQ